MLIGVRHFGREKKGGGGDGKKECEEKEARGKRTVDKSGSCHMLGGDKKEKCADIDF